MNSYNKTKNIIANINTLLLFILLFIQIYRFYQVDLIRVTVLIFHKMRPGKNRKITSLQAEHTRDKEIKGTQIYSRIEKD